MSTNHLGSSSGQKAFKNFSKWSLLDKYYNAKKAYYNGNPKLTDWEFDALERTFVAIHSQATLDKCGCVGYNVKRHTNIKKLLELAKFRTYKISILDGVRVIHSGEEITLEEVNILIKTAREAL